MIEESSPPQVPHVGKSQPSESDRNIITAAKGGGITFAGNIIAYVNRFLFSIVIARFLGAEQFGLYNLGYTVTTTVGGLVSAGLIGGMSYFLPIAIKERNTNKMWGVIQIGAGVPLISSIIVTVIFLFVVQPISNQMFKEPVLAPILYLLALTIPLSVISSSLSTIAQSFKQLQYDVYADNIAHNLVKFILAVVLLILGWGVMGVTIAYVGATFTTMVVLFYFVHRRLFSFKRPLNPAQRNFREMSRYSFPLYLSRLLNSYSRQFETLVLGFFGVVTEVGVYAAVLRVSDVGNMFFSSLRKISVPIIPQLYSQGKIDELKRFYQTTTKWSVTFNLPFFITICLFARPLLSIFGQDFTVGATGLIILSGAALFNAATGNCGTVINMTGHSKLGLINSIFYLVSTIILDFLLIPQFHLLGAAWAGALTILLNNTLRLIEVYYLIEGLLPYNRTFWKPVVAGLLAAGSTYLLAQLILTDWPFLQFIILAPTMWVIYAAAILMFKLSDEDRLILDKLDSRLNIRKKFKFI